MSGCELVILGTASQTPTRRRNHNGYLLRLDGEGLLVDPGEGTQRQLILAGVSPSAITRIAITHAHGDHCLGLPGVLQRLALDGVERTIPIHTPAASAETIAALAAVVPPEHPVPVEIHGEQPGEGLAQVGGFMLRAAELDHSVPTLGWRLDEPDGWQLLPDALTAAGVDGPDRERLREQGRVEVEGRAVHLDEVALPRPGRSVAVVMDTRRCEGALELAADVDLLLIEATFLESEREIGEVAGHLTAAGAARLAAEAGARTVVLTHLSQRYPDPTAHLAEARATAPDLDIRVAEDLEVIPVPRRRPDAG